MFAIYALQENHTTCSINSVKTIAKIISINVFIANLENPIPANLANPVLDSSTVNADLSAKTL